MFTVPVINNSELFHQVVFTFLTQISITVIFLMIRLFVIEARAYLQVLGVFALYLPAFANCGSALVPSFEVCPLVTYFQF